MDVGYQGCPIYKDFAPNEANTQADQSEMIYKFFKCQWDQPVHLDWTEQAKSDLSDLDFPVSLEFLRSKSKNVFQKLVKEKIKNYAFCELLQGKRSKLENLNYIKVEI